MGDSARSDSKAGQKLSVLLDIHKTVIERRAAVYALRNQDAHAYSFSGVRGGGGYSDTISLRLERVERAEKRLESAEAHLKAAQRKASKAIRMIPHERQRQAVAGKYVYGMSNAKLAQWLGCSPSHAMRLVRQGLDSLDSILYTVECRLKLKEANVEPHQVERET